MITVVYKGRLKVNMICFSKHDNFLFQIQKLISSASCGIYEMMHPCRIGNQAQEQNVDMSTSVLPKILRESGTDPPVGNYSPSLALFLHVPFRTKEVKLSGIKFLAGESKSDLRWLPSK